MQLAIGDRLAIALLEAKGFSARDFRVFHPGGSLGASLKHVSDLMHKGETLPLAGLDLPMQDALVVMTQKSFGCLGIVDAAGQLVGVITDGDLRRHMGENLIRASTAEIMTRKPKFTAPDALASSALEMMNASRITALFVVEKGKPGRHRARSRPVARRRGVSLHLHCAPDRMTRHAMTAGSSVAPHSRIAVWIVDSTPSPPAIPAEPATLGRECAPPRQSATPRASRLGAAPGTFGYSGEQLAPLAFALRRLQLGQRRRRLHGGNRFARKHALQLRLQLVLGRCGGGQEFPRSRRRKSSTWKWLVPPSM